MTFFVLTSIAVLCALVWLGIICYKQHTTIDALKIECSNANDETLALEHEIRRVATELQTDERDFRGKQKWIAVIRNVIRNDAVLGSSKPRITWGKEFDEHFSTVEYFLNHGKSKTEQPEETIKSEEPEIKITT